MSVILHPDGLLHQYRHHKRECIPTPLPVPCTSIWKVNGTILASSATSTTNSLVSRFVSLSASPGLHFCVCISTSRECVLLSPILPLREILVYTKSSPVWRNPVCGASCTNPARQKHSSHVSSPATDNLELRLYVLSPATEIWNWQLSTVITTSKFPTNPSILHPLHFGIIAHLVSCHG